MIFTLIYKKINSGRVEYSFNAALKIINTMCVARALMNMSKAN